MGAAAPLISVVIPTYNRQALLARTLPTVFAQDMAADDYEVIVVVDGSTDGSADWLRGLASPVAFRVLEQPNRGPAAARNAGVAVARGGIVLFLDDDILCGPTLLREHAAAHDGPESRMVFGQVLVAADSPDSLATDRTRQDTTGWVARVDRDKEPGWPYDAIVDANSSVPRAALLECGGFDERFGRQRETADLGLRLWAMGIRFHYRPGAVVHLVYVKSSKDIVRRDAREYGRHSVLLCRKHPVYRPYSAVAGQGRGPWWRRGLRSAALRLPVSPEPVLRGPVWVAERLRRHRAFRRLGIKLLTMQHSIVLLRSAARETGSWRALRREFGATLPILLYHHVGPPRPGTYPELTISPERFEQQVRWLASHGYVGIRPSDWQAWRLGAGTLPDKPVLLTFDDGYADLAEFALPVLERHGFGGAVFVVTGEVGGTNRWDEEQGAGTHRLMRADQIREWSARGIEIGAHSRAHSNLTELSDADLASELSGCASDLADLLGRPPAAFAYPYGYYDERVTERVRQAFDLAFTCDEGMNDLRTDPHVLRRTMVQPGDVWPDLGLRVRLGWSPIERLRGRLRLRTRMAATVKRLGIPVR
ncbi:MAG TPA: glycosyltransferase [Methylomirabilota bacterium]|nr:glycosyltransferase [Methylomirabilota bacterium]